MCGGGVKDLSSDSRFLRQLQSRAHQQPSSNRQGLIHVPAKPKPHVPLVTTANMSAPIPKDFKAEDAENLEDVCSPRLPDDYRRS